MSEPQQHRHHSGTLVRLDGTVVKGFGRGGKELGCPTANFEQTVVDTLPAHIEQGIYFGWAQVDNGPVYKAVMSIGWNPFYKNEKRSAEVHILHKFADDFYGHRLRMLICGHIRPEKNFDSLESLVAEINNDIAIARQELDLPGMAKQQHSDFFSPPQP